MRTCLSFSLAMHLLLVPIVARAQVCPTNQYQHSMRGPSPVTTTAARLDPQPERPIDVTYDLVGGTMRLHSPLGGGFVRVSDVYRIVGPGTASVACLATVNIAPVLVFAFQDCHQFGIATASVTVSEGTSSQTWADEASCFRSVVDPVRIHLPVSHIPGQPFTLTFDVQATAGFSTADVDVAFGFSGLPAGYSVQSCQGLAYAPVSTRATSWGSLKTYYR